MLLDGDLKLIIYFGCVEAEIFFGRLTPGSAKISSLPALFFTYHLKF